MPIAGRQLALLLLVLTAGVFASREESSKKHHHHKHHKHHRHHGHNSSAAKNATAANASATARPVSEHGKIADVPKALVSSGANTSEKLIISKMKELEKDLSSQRKLEDLTLQKVQLKVNAPLPKNFDMLFAQGISSATGCKMAEVKVLSTLLMPDGKVDEVTFEAPRFAALDARQQAADPDSKLARGSLRLFLMAKDEEEEEGAKEEKDEKEETEEKEKEDEEEAAAPGAAPAPAPTMSPASDAQMGEMKAGGVDIDTEMPFGDLEPFGREDTAQELTESSIEESNAMVDQLERAEVAEEKRAVFRALTRLRGAAITSFDGVARAQTGNIDEYSKLNKWRHAHPLHHLAEDESDISKWAFPDADF